MDHLTSADLTPFSGFNYFLIEKLHLLLVEFAKQMVPNNIFINEYIQINIIVISSVKSLSHVRLFATP